MDEWELDERIGRDAKLFVENRMQACPAVIQINFKKLSNFNPNFQLEKWVSSQFRRQSYFAPNGSEQFSSQKTEQTDFASQLIQRAKGNFVALQLAMGMLAEGRLSSLGAMPSELGQLYSMHFRHKFP